MARKKENYGRVIDFDLFLCYTTERKQTKRRKDFMKHIKTLKTRNLCASAKNGGCGECQTSCQSACKTSCGIANQQCENKKESK
jgi:predicted ribosomally synthesized six-cysteine peptide SCIFF